MNFLGTQQGRQRPLGAAAPGHKNNDTQHANTHWRRWTRTRRQAAAAPLAPFLPAPDPNSSHPFPPPPLLATWHAPLSLRSIALLAPSTPPRRTANVHPALPSPLVSVATCSLGEREGNQLALRGRLICPPHSPAGGECQSARKRTAAARLPAPRVRATAAGGRATPGGGQEGPLLV